MPELKFFPETHVAFVSEVGPYRRAVSRGFKRLFDWLHAHHLEPVGQSLVILYDDPTKVAEENLKSDLCAPVGPHVTGSDEVQTKEIGGWRVATTVFQGEENERSAFDELYHWLRDQGYREADAPIEKYISQLGEELRAEIAVPVVEQAHMPGKQKAKAKIATRKTAAKKAATSKAGARRKSTPRKSQ